MSGTSQPHVGHLRILDPEVEAIPSADGFTSYIPVAPSPVVSERAHGTRGATPVVWSPERGWLCAEHTILPCEHTAGLPNPGIREVI